MNKSHRILQLICGVAAVWLVSSSYADLILTVDPGTKTFTFSGSDTGASQDLFSSVQIVSWDFGATSGPPETVDVSAGFVETFSNGATLTVRDGNLEDGLRLFLANNGGVANSFNTATANSTPIDYSSLSPSFVTILESFGNDTLTLNQGTGFNAIEFTTIPESGSTTLISVAVALIACRRRKSGTRAQ